MGPATYRGLGFDPAPGDLGAVSQAIEQLTAAAAALSGIQPALRRAEERSADWHGEAAEAFRARLRSTPAEFDARQRAIRRATAALDRWADVLVANKRRAEELDQQAVRLRKRIDLAMDELQHRQGAADLAATTAAAASAQADLAAMSTLVADLETALAEVLDKARRLEREHLRAADGVADELAADQPVPRRRDEVGGMIGTVGAALDRAARTSSTLARLLPAGTRPVAVPAGTRPVAVPGGAAGALADAVESSGGIARR